MVKWFLNICFTMASNVLISDVYYLRCNENDKSLEVFLQAAML